MVAKFVEIVGIVRELEFIFSVKKRMALGQRNAFLSANPRGPPTHSVRGLHSFCFVALILHPKAHGRSWTHEADCRDRRLGGYDRRPPVRRLEPQPRSNPAAAN